MTETKEIKIENHFVKDIPDAFKMIREGKHGYFYVYKLGKWCFEIVCGEKNAGICPFSENGVPENLKAIEIPPLDC